MPMCPYCHTIVSEDNRFCPECGRRLTIGQDAKGMSKKKLAGIIVVCIIVVIAVIVAVRLPTVSFADSNLEAAVRDAIGKPTGLIYPSGLKDFYAADRNIIDLSGLECCIDLTGLDLDGNHVSDISPLANLTNLTWLNLEDNQVSDISPLANLTNLTWLKLHSNEISDLSPLANLTSLSHLLLGDNQISDISPLVQNQGLGTGDWVFLHMNPLSSDSINIYIPQLQARGVEVVW